MDMTKKENRQEFLDKSLKVLLFIYTLLFILYDTVAGYFALAWLERLECITGALLTAAMVWKLLSLDRNEKKKWLKASVLVFIYFVVRIVSFISSGFQYDVAKSAFFEGVYLFVICGMIIDSDFCRQKIMKFFVIINFVLNVINVMAYHMLTNLSADSAICSFLREYTYFGETGYATSSMYVTPNIFGIMTAFAMIIAFNLISEKDTLFRKIMIACYMLFSLYCIYLSACTSVMLSLFAVLICWAVVTLSSKITGRMLVIAAFSFVLVVTAGLYTFIGVNSETGMVDFTDNEMEFQAVSTGRYSIWKAGYYATEDSRLTGVGCLSNEVNERNGFLYRDYINNSDSEQKFVADFRGPNNGYLAMIYCTGILGFIAFMGVFLQKILRAESLKSGDWYLPVIYFMAINMFEAMTIVSKLFICLLTFIILAMDNKEFKQKG